MTIKIFTKDFCPFCTNARKLLDEKKIAFEEVNVTQNEELLSELKERTGQKTIPIVFVNKSHLGGFDELQNHIAIQELISQISRSDGLMIDLIQKIIISLIALLHIQILVLEMFSWNTPKGRKVFGTTKEEAEMTTVNAAN